MVDNDLCVSLYNAGIIDADGHLLDAFADYDVLFPMLDGWLLNYGPNQLAIFLMGDSCASHLVPDTDTDSSTDPSTDTTSNTSTNIDSDTTLVTLCDLAIAGEGKFAAYEQVSASYVDASSDSQEIIGTSDDYLDAGSGNDVICGGGQRHHHRRLRQRQH